MSKQDDIGKYDDIINLPHHVSATRPRMAAIDRAAQFSPFAALTGYEGAIAETGRMTEGRVELDEDSKSIQNEKLQMAMEFPDANQQFTYFLTDMKKTGGAYVTVSGKIKKIDAYKKIIILTDGTSFPIDDVVEIESVRDSVDAR